MSKNRIGNKVRKNRDYEAITAFLDNLGLKHRVNGPTGKGHPFLSITLPCGKLIEHRIACTPRAGGHAQGALSHLKKMLASHGHQY